MEEKLKGLRIEISKHENWCLTPEERFLIREMIQCLKLSGRDGLTLTQLYVQSLTDGQNATIKASDIHNEKRNKIKYLLMLLWKRNKVRIKYNNGYCLIKWRNRRR